MNIPISHVAQSIDDTVGLENFYFGGPVNVSSGEARGFKVGVKGRVREGVYQWWANPNRDSI
jgi:hypothetical protein